MNYEEDQPPLNEIYTAIERLEQLLQEKDKEIIRLRDILQRERAAIKKLLEL